MCPYHTWTSVTSDANLDEPIEQPATEILPRKWPHGDDKMTSWVDEFGAHRESNDFFVASSYILLFKCAA